MRYCTNCGTPTSREQTYCTQCGGFLAPAAKPDTATVGPGPNPPPAGAEPPSHAPTWPPPTTGTESASPTSTGLPSPSPLPQPSANRRPMVIATLAAVALLAAGGVVAWEVIGHHTAHPAATPTVSTSLISQSGSTPASAKSQASPTPASQPTADSAIVAIAPSAGQQPNAPQVARFLATYFTAINTHDFRLYSSLFEPQLQLTQQQFNQGYQSTSDSDMTLTSLSATAAGVAAVVSFTSHQQPADSPTNSSCTSWDITLYLQPQGGTYLIGSPPADYHAVYSSCS